MNRTRHPLYMKWYDMIRRCNNPGRECYRNYGGRGITVCERWMNFQNFCEDIEASIGPCPPGCAIDRIDNDGHYEPGNVRWATRSEQERNKRHGLPKAKPKPNPSWLTYRARTASVKYPTVWARVNKLGWPVELALTLPLRAKLQVTP